MSESTDAPDERCIPDEPILSSDILAVGVTATVDCYAEDDEDLRFLSAIA